MTNVRSIFLVVASVAVVLAFTTGSATGAGGYLAAKRSHGPLSYRLADVANGSLRGASRAKSEQLTGLPRTGPGSLMRKGSRYVVDARTAGPPRAARGRLDHLHGVRALATAGGAVTVAARAGALHRLARTSGVESVTEQLTPMVGGIGRPKAAPCQGSRTSEALTQLHADTVQNDLGDTGSGVRVGVLSDSFDTRAAAPHAAQDIATGDLPGSGNPCGRTTPVQDLTDAAGFTDEGRAMLQAVHDLAPDASLAFDTAEGGDTVFAQHIRDLATAGAKVIADDIIYFNEPMFQDGVIAKAVNDVANQGATYFSMAFNNNDVDSSGRDIGSWEAPAFRDSGSCPAAFGTGHCMDFNPGSGADNTFGITVAPGGTVQVDLQWNEPLNGVTTNLDEGLLNSTNTTVLTSSLLSNTATQRPFEFMSWTNASGSAVAVNLVINNFTGSHTPRLKFVFFTNGSNAIQSTEYPTSSGGDIVGPTIFGHNGTAGAQTVAAVPFNDSAIPEPYSSRGPLAHYFGPVSGSTPAAPLISPEVLDKPDIAATDCAQNTFFGQNVGGGVFRFCGTSQATPHAAAVAALELSADPSAANTDIKAAQTSTATAMPGFGHPVVGAGLVNAPLAVGRFISPPTVTVTGPHGRVADSTPSFQFSASRPVAFTCAFDSRAPQLCSSPLTAPRLSDTRHTLTVAGDDDFGTIGLRTVSFTVDTTGPKSKISHHPRRKTHKRRAKFKFKAKGAASDVAGFKCKLDHRRFKTCRSPKKVEVKPGKHTFQVEAIDDLGNAGKRAEFKWKVKG